MLGVPAEPGVFNDWQRLGSQFLQIGPERLRRPAQDGMEDERVADQPVRVIPIEHGGHLERLLLVIEACGRLRGRGRAELGSLYLAPQRRAHQRGKVVAVGMAVGAK